MVAALAMRAPDAQPPANITVNTPAHTINVAPAAVDVRAADPTPVTIVNQVNPTPVEVNVRNDVAPTPVEVNATFEATVHPAEVVLSMPDRKTETDVQRDQDGNIVHTTQIETSL